MPAEQGPGRPWSWEATPGCARRVRRFHRTRRGLHSARTQEFDTVVYTSINPLTSAGWGILGTERRSEGGLAGDLSPADGLTQFLGAADGSGGSSVPLKNCVLFLVANHPLPTATATIAGQNGNGWINSTSAGTISATFNSSAATYAPGAANPPSNKFVPAPPYSLTYGISTWPALPDTTYPVAGDATNYNTAGNVNPNLRREREQLVTPLSFRSDSGYSRFVYLLLHRQPIVHRSEQRHLQRPLLHDRLRPHRRAGL